MHRQNQACLSSKVDTDSVSDQCSFKEYPHRVCPQIQEAKATEKRFHGIMWKNLCLDKALFHLEKGSLPLPTIREFAWILQRCRKTKSSSCALQLYGYMKRNGIEDHSLLGNYLVPLLTESGYILDARHVFDKMLFRNEWSWSSLICGYAKLGRPEESLHLYNGMRKDHSLYPLGHTYVTLLKACVQLKDLERGLDIHGEVARNGLLERDPFMGSSLVDMYAKCGSILKAQEVFDGLQVQDIVTWTALIAGYAEHGHSEAALMCYEKMRLDGILPDAATIVCVLKACSSMRSLDRGREIHMEIERQGWVKKSLFIGNALIDLYVKSGYFAKARQVLGEMLYPDVISWTSLIYGYSEHGDNLEAIGCFEEMQIKGVHPNLVTFICLLKACGGLGDIEKGLEIHTKIVKLGLMESDVVIGNILVDMYAKCGLPEAAHHMFDRIPIRNVVSWAALVQGYVEAELAKEALQCFDQMQIEGISPDAISFISGLKACSLLRAIEKGEELHLQIKTLGLLEGDDVLGNTLIDMYVKCDSLFKAQCVFDELETRDVVSWTLIITGHTQYGAYKQALRCFEQMQLEGIHPNSITLVCALKSCSSIRDIFKGQQLHVYIESHGLVEKDTSVGNTLIDMYAKCGFLAMARYVFNRLPGHTLVSWSALISGYAAYGQPEVAINYFEQMGLKGFSPDAITFVCFLKACGSIGAMDKVREVHAEVENRGMVTTNVVGNTLVHIYAKCGLISKAQQVFESLLVQDVFSWTSFMVGYARLGETEKVCSLFEQMLGAGVKPDPVTFVVVLNACVRAGFFEFTRSYYELMSKGYGMMPNFQHNVCIIDLFARYGQVDKAIEMIKKMPICSNATTWNIMLNACNNWGNLEFARKVFKHASVEKNSVTYVLMSHVCAGGK